MRIGINLASRPYQDEGRFYRIWGAALAFMILLTALMITASARHYVNSRKDWASARAAETKLANLRKEESQARQILAEPQNRGTRDRSQFLNIAILRKSFSWTRLMEDMEKVMPAGLRVVSIAPVVDQHNRFVLKVQVQGENRESTIELLRNMEKSQHFRSPELVAESLTPGNRGSALAGVKSDIVTSYLPAEPLEGGE
jgi:type IV pilus assembly protein PilN